VYPVFVLEDANSRVTGAIAFFVPDWALGVEDKSKEPARIADVARPVHIGEIDTPGALLFNEAHTGHDSTDMTVDVDVPPGRYEVIAWLGEVPMLRENGMEPFVRPIAVGVYGTDLVSALDGEFIVDRDPAAFEAYRPWNTMMWGVMGHKAPEWGRAARYNHADDTKRGEQERATSWLLQAAVHGDADAQDSVAHILHALDPATSERRTRLLAMRGQGPTAAGVPLADPALIDRAMSADEAVRDRARRTIIDEVDVAAMVACADRARVAGDDEDEEFWWIEVATAPRPAGDSEITRGVVGLCDRILLPQGRFEEAEMYGRHLLTRVSDDSRAQGRALLERIESERRSRGVRRLVASEAWKRVDVTQPGSVSTDQQVHYDRVYAIIVAYAEDGRMDLLTSATQDAFLPNVIGWLNGVSRGGKSAAIGLERDTAARALAQWLMDNGSPHLARDQAPGGNVLTKRSSGL
jgi:hypothetical protein